MLARIIFSPPKQLSVSQDRSLRYRPIPHLRIAQRDRESAALRVNRIINTRSVCALCSLQQQHSANKRAWGSMAKMASRIGYTSRSRLSLSRLYAPGGFRTWINAVSLAYIYRSTHQRRFVGCYIYNTYNIASATRGIELNCAVYTYYIPIYLTKRRHNWRGYWTAAAGRRGRRLNIVIYTMQLGIVVQSETCRMQRSSWLGKC